MTIEIRTIREEELGAYLDAALTAFLERRTDLTRIVEEVRSVWDLSRTWAAFADGRVCGTFRSWATEITVPGGRRLPAAAVAGVTVLPTHRRRGILRSLVAVEHGSARERGEIVSLLYASEYPIYGRFGYGVGCRQATWSLDAAATGFHASPPGTVEIVPSDAVARATLVDVYEAWRHRQPGEIRRFDVRWDRDLGLSPDPWGEGWKGFLALHRDPGGLVDGYVRYTAESRWERGQPRNVIKVDELHALTDDAYAGLWRFLAETDWVASVRAERRTPSERLPWLLTNARAAALEDVGDGLWVRLLDVAAALEARTYAVADTIVLDVVDAEVSTGRQRLLLEATPDGARCRPTTRSADLTVPVAALGAAYLGGTRLRDAARAGGADAHRAGALEAADRLFRLPDEPWCSTFF